MSCCMALNGQGHTGRHQGWKIRQAQGMEVVSRAIRNSSRPGQGRQDWGRGQDRQCSGLIRQETAWDRHRQGKAPQSTGQDRAGQGREGQGGAGKGRAAARAQTSRGLGPPINLSLLARVHEPLPCVCTPPDAHLAVWPQGCSRVCNGFVRHQVPEGALRPMLHILNQLLELPHCKNQSINQSIHQSIHQSIFINHSITMQTLGTPDARLAMQAEYKSRCMQYPKQDCHCCCSEQRIVCV